MTSLVGRALGRYQIEAEIGRGGMARVYRAVDTSLRRQVALKVLAPQLAVDAEFLRRFEREAITAANLRHPHIVTVYDVGQADGMHYIAMEFIRGRTLYAILRDQGGLGLDFTIGIIEPVASALDHAHALGAVHRDIKPQNILIDIDGRVLLTDFGISQAPEQHETGERLTRTGVFMGTPEYISPEQATAQRVDGRSDLYSLGITAYEVLTGSVPFSGATPQLIVAHVQSPPPPPSLVDPTQPRELDVVMARALAKRPDQRFGSGAAFIEALRVVARHNDIAPATRAMIAELAQSPTPRPRPIPPTAPVPIGGEITARAPAPAPQQPRSQPAAQRRETPQRVRVATPPPSRAGAPRGAAYRNTIAGLPANWVVYGTAGALLATMLIYAIASVWRTPPPLRPAITPGLTIEVPTTTPLPTATLVPPSQTPVPPTVPIPTNTPEPLPTNVPTAEPPVLPTAEPPVQPTVEPTSEQTVQPTVEPTAISTVELTIEPTAAAPTVQATAAPTVQTTAVPPVATTAALPQLTPVVKNTSAATSGSTPAATLAPPAQTPTAPPPTAPIAPPTTAPPPTTPPTTTPPTTPPTTLPTTPPTDPPTAVPTAAPTDTPTPTP